VSTLDLFPAPALEAIVPRPGCGLVGARGDDRVYVMPSNLPGYFYVAGVWDQPSGSAIAHGTTKPVRIDAVRLVLDALLWPISSTTWSEIPWRPSGRNLWVST
jgi:hypothetical protein